MVRITIKVIPGAGFNAWKRDKSGTLICYLKSQPEKGLANKELICLLAKELRIRQQDILIITGLTHRRKMVGIVGFDTGDQVISQLGVDKQDKQLDLFDKNNK